MSLQWRKNIMVKKILIADDEKSIRELIKRVLLRKRYKIITASNGKDALDKIYSESPDLVILDIMMPEMDGWQVCKKIRQDPLYKNLSIIMLTVKKSDADQIKGLNIGSDEYMTKPFYPTELIFRVNKILQKQTK
jgi:DNA-binding response OmpR family regulator